MSLMGIDVGTTGCKAVAFDHDGALLARAAREYPLLSPHPGWYELDPERVWSDVCDCLREVNAQLRQDPATALALTSQGEAMIPVTRDGKALANSPISSDRRNLPQTARMESDWGAQRLFAITGQPMGAIFTLPKVLWWREHAPHLLNESWKILCYVDFVAFKLGAQAAIDYSMAARTLAFDVHRLDWSDELLAYGGLTREQLAKPVPSGTVIGEVSGRLAAALGFQSAVTVVTGGHDQPAGALGAGLLAPGKAMLSIGTTEALVAVTDAPRMEMLEQHVACYPHAAPGQFIALNGNQTGGRLLRWYRDELGAAEMTLADREGRDVYEIIVEQVEDAPGDLLLLPYFVGSGGLHDDPQATGALVGLSFDSKRADIVRAIMEGLSYEIALMLGKLNEIGLEIGQLTAVGGGSRSDLWMQFKADICGMPVSALHTAEAASLGAAMLAGWATSVYGSLDEAAGQLIRLRRTFAPRDGRVAHYQGQLRRYADFYAALQPIYESMA